MMTRMIYVFLALMPIHPNYGSILSFQEGLQKRFREITHTDNDQKIILLKKDILNFSGKAVPLLVDVMKSKDYPDASRWLATSLLGRIMGKKSSPFIAKFLNHPNWVLRMASLKTLLSLKDNRYSKEYAKALKDNSLLVRKQALENIVQLKIKDKAPYVWAMLYDERNYYNSKKKKGKTTLIRSVIRAIGDLKFKKALMPLTSMMQKKEYADVRSDIRYSLHLITGQSNIQK